MESITKIIAVFVALAIAVELVSSNPIEEMTNQATNMATDLTSKAMDMAKTALSVVEKAPGAEGIPGVGQMSEMKNHAFDMVKIMMKPFKDMATKAKEMIPTPSS